MPHDSKIKFSLGSKPPKILLEYLNEHPPLYPKSLFDLISIQIQTMHEDIEKNIERVLRNAVIPPIKGKITKGKLKWRGISSILYSVGENYPIGIMQRDKIIYFKKKDNERNII